MLIPPFSHHVISLLPGALDGKVSPTAVKKAARTIERVNGVLKLACRHESVVIPMGEDPVSASGVPARSLQTAWGVIREAMNLQWIILTAEPERIRSALPANWIGKGYRNVCFGAIVRDEENIDEVVRALRAVPCCFRMLLLPVVPAHPPSREVLAGVQWVVAVGPSHDQEHAENLRMACQAANTPFLFLGSDQRISGLTGSFEQRDDDGWIEHPFGKDFQLRRPTHPHLRSGELPPVMLNGRPASRIAYTSSIGDMASEEDHIPQETETPLFDNSRTTDVSTDTVPLRDAQQTDLPSIATEIPVISKVERQDFSRLDRTVRRDASAFISCGLALAEIHDRKLWRAGNHASWESYLRSALGMSKPHAHRLVQAARVATEIGEALPIGNDATPYVRPVSESQVRPLCRLKDARQRTAAWNLAIKRADGQPTAKLIGEVVADLMAEETPDRAPRTSARKQRIQELLDKLRAAMAEDSAPRRATALFEELASLLR